MGETRPTIEGDDIGNPSVRLCEIVHRAGSCGFNLSKSKWDPYPWVSTVDEGSPAAAAGVLPGDCVLEVNGDDILGLRVGEVASRVRSRGDRATVMLWNPGIDCHCTPETLCCGPMPANLQRLTSCMSNILVALECPICLEITTPPTHQCANGHIICVNCRGRTERCPVCRLRFFRGRCLLADQVFESMVDAFELRSEDESNRSRLLFHRVYGAKKPNKKSKPEIKLNLLSPTNKFLTRIMGTGKSTSVDNLASRDLESNLHLDADLIFKGKSLSSNEIFQGDPATVSRTSSVLSSRPGSGLLDVNDISLEPRPASYHGSAGDLQTRLLTDFGIDFRSARNDTSFCPMFPECRTRISSSMIRKHIQESHDGPLIQFFNSNVTLPLIWIRNSSVTVIEVHDSLFCARANEERAWVCLLEGNEKFRATFRINDQQFQCDVVNLNDIEEIDAFGVMLPKNVNENVKIAISITRLIQFNA